MIRIQEEHGIDRLRSQVRIAQIRQHRGQRHPRRQRRPFVLLRRPFLQNDLQARAGRPFQDCRDQLARLSQRDDRRTLITRAVGQQFSGDFADGQRQQPVRFPARFRRFSGR